MPVDRVRVALERATDTREILVGEGTLAVVPEVLLRRFEDRQAFVIADENTHGAAGRAVDEHLRATGLRAREALVFPGAPVLHADFEHALEIEQQIRAVDATPIAVGSGTINDLVKLAAHRCGRPYMAVATAASVDGYAAFAAAITHGGIKKVDACPAPLAVVVDIDVLAAAPSAMAASGYGDLLGKVIGGADWLLADALGVEVIDGAAWELVQPHLRGWVDDPSSLARRDRPALGRLIEGLLLSGLAMQAARSSRPAAGSEHVFSHLWEMEGLAPGGVAPSHGFKVGLGTLAAAALYDWLLERDLRALDIEGRCVGWPSPEQLREYILRAFREPVLAESAAEEMLAGYPTQTELRQRLGDLAGEWPLLRQRLRGQLLPAPALQAMLRQAGCPTTPEELGMSRSELASSYARARLIRRRYTVLSLVAEAGLLDASVHDLFVAGGFWSESHGRQMSGE
jgi:glycerol-1-phosphate dehydrogenase [NAD(P)+]